MTQTIPATPSPTPSDSGMQRIAWALMDAWVITRRDLQHWRLQPGPVILGWVFPIMIVLMFGLLFGGAIPVPDDGSYFEVMMPGMFAMTMLFGIETTMVAVTTDAAKGITDRFRSMPMNASAVVLGRCLADMLNSLIGLIVLIGTGLLVGWRWNNGVGAALAAFGLLLLLRFAVLWMGIFMGLNAKGPEAVVSIQILVWPVSFLSNILVDPDTMPAWLGAIAQWNPLSATASATRELFSNPGWQGGSWMAGHAVLMAVAWPVLMIAIFMPLSIRKYRRLSR